MFGGQGGNNEQRPEAASYRAHTSTEGMCIPVVYGRQRVSGNLIWYSNFTPVWHENKQSSGKGGSGGGASTGGYYDYYVAAAFAICEGPIARIATGWKGKKKFRPETSDLDNGSAFLGTIPQSAWPYLTANSPNKAMSYPGIAYYAAPSLYMGRSANMPNYNFEVVGPLALGLLSVSQSATFHTTSNRITVSDVNQFPNGRAFRVSATTMPTIRRGDGSTFPLSTAVDYYVIARDDTSFQLSGLPGGGAYDFATAGSGVVLNCYIDDALPSQIITDVLTNTSLGVGFPAANIDAMTDYAAYCQSAGLFVSVALDSQSTAASLLDSLMLTTNSAIVWSGGKLKVVPYADEAIAGNGATFTPNITPVYDLTDDDFIVDGSDDPVIVTRRGQADTYNAVSIEFVSRNHQYNATVIDAKDQANIEQYGLRKMDQITAHHICEPTIARYVAQNILQRQLYVRNVYEFNLGWKYCLLEPMDLVTLTDSALGLDKTVVRITEIREDSDGLLSITAVEWLGGTHNATLYPSPIPDVETPDYSADPGSVNAPLIFEPPVALTGGGLELWLGASGSSAFYGGCDVFVSNDNATYTRIGTIQGNARQGALTAALPSVADPDNTSTLSVDLSESLGSLISVSAADAANWNTLALVDNELIAYQTATLTGANAYNLTTLRRGGYGSTVAAHSIGAPFYRLDRAIVKYPFEGSRIGDTLYFKFCAWNVFGEALQDIATAVAYAYTIVGEPAQVPTGISVVGDWRQIIVGWTNPTNKDFDHVEVWVAATNNLGVATLAGSIAGTKFIIAGLDSAVTRYVWLRSVNKAGNVSAYSAGYSATTLNEAAQIIGNLTGMISETQLTASLGGRITGAESNIYWLQHEAGVVKADITQEITDRNAAVSQEISDRIAALTTEAATRTNADTALESRLWWIEHETGNASAMIYDEQIIRQTADSNEVISRQALSSKLTGLTDPSSATLATLSSGLIYDERVLRQTTDDSLATQISLITAGVAGAFDAYQLWYFDSTVEGWTATGTTLTATGGWITWGTMTANGVVYLASDFTAFSGAQYAIIGARIKRTAGTGWTGKADYKLSGAGGFSTNYKLVSTNPVPSVGDIATVQWDMSSLTVGGTDWATHNIVNIRLTLGATSADKFDIDFIGIGRNAPGASTAALLAEQTARAAADSSEVTSRQALSTKLTGLADPSSATLASLSSGLLYDERTARSSDVASLVSTTNSLQAQVNSSNAAITAEQTARAAADDASAVDRYWASAEIGNASADIITEQQVRATADSALSSQITSLTATVGTNTADITAEQTARANADSAITTSVNALTTTVNGHTTSISTLNTTVSTVDTSKAVSDYWAASEIGQNSAQVEVHTDSINGLSAQWTAKIDVNGYVSGFGLASDTINGTPTSSFIVRADRFGITNGTNPRNVITAGNLTRSGTTATLVYSAHGLVVGDYIEIRGVNLGTDATNSFPQGWNGLWKVATVPNANSVTFTVPSTFSTPATGTAMDWTKSYTPFAVLTATDANGNLPGVYIESAFIKNAAITTAKITDLSVTAAKIANATITAAQIQDAAITSAKIQDASITSAKIGAAQVSTLKLAGNSVTIPEQFYASASVSIDTVGVSLASLVLTPDSEAMPRSITFSCQFAAGNTSVSDATVSFIFKVNGVTDFSMFRAVARWPAASGTTAYIIPISMATIIQTAANTNYTIEVVGIIDTSLGILPMASFRSLTSIGMKR